MKKIKPKFAINLNVPRLAFGQIASDQPLAYPIKEMRKKTQRNSLVEISFIV